MKWLMLTISLFFTCFVFGGEKDHDNDHDKKLAKHGGKVLEVGDHVAHIEFVHDEKTGKVTLYILDAKGVAMNVKKAPKLNLLVNKKKKQVLTKNKGVSKSVFEATDTVLKMHDLVGRIAIKIKDKMYQVKLPDDHDHGDHDHGKDKHKGHDHD